MLSFPKIGNIVFRLGATCKIKYHRMRCKEMLNCFLFGAKCVPVYSAQSGRSGSATLAANLLVKESVFPRHGG